MTELESMTVTAKVLPPVPPDIEVTIKLTREQAQQLYEAIRGPEYATDYEPRHYLHSKLARALNWALYPAPTIESPLPTMGPYADPLNRL